MAKLVLTAKAKKDLKKLDKAVAKRIAVAFSDLEADKKTPEILTGSWSGFLKLRVGDYRIILERTGRDVYTAHFIGHRKDIYKRSL